MKLLKNILLILVLAVVGIVIAAVTTQSTNYDLNQSLVIEATPSNVTDYLSDLKTWSTWGPWNKEDTTIVTTYGEITKGKGASMTWTSASGPGELTISEIEPGKSMATKMDMGGSPAEGYWNFESEGDGTKVTWGMKGQKNLMFKIFAMFMGFDEYMGKMQLKGLEGIQANIGDYNSEAPSAFKLSEIEVMEMTEKFLIGYSHSGGMEDIQTNFQADMPKAGMFAGSEGITKYTPGAVWTKWDEENNQAEYSIGLIVSNADKMAEGMVKTSIPAGKVVKISKWGAYGSGDKEAHEAIGKYMEENGLSHLLTWEEYANDPMKVKPEEVRTDILYAVK